MDQVYKAFEKRIKRVFIGGLVIGLVAGALLGAFSEATLIMHIIHG